MTDRTQIPTKQYRKTYTLVCYCQNKLTKTKKKVVGIIDFKNPFIIKNRELYFKTLRNLRLDECIINKKVI